MPEYATVSWDKLHRDACDLAARLAPLGPWSGIVAVSRGGLVPAAIVARELDCRVVETISVASYEEERLGELQLLKPPAAAGNGQGFVIIDDLVDRGGTARLVRSLLPAAYFACLYAKPEGQGTADMFISAVPQATWVVFPWDMPPAAV